MKKPCIRFIFVILSSITITSCGTWDTNNFSQYSPLDTVSHISGAFSWLFYGNRQQCINLLKYNNPDAIDRAQTEVGMNSYETSFGKPHGCLGSDRKDY